MATESLTVPASDLLERGGTDTEEMLPTVLAGVGVGDVDVAFERPPRS